MKHLCMLNTKWMLYLIYMINSHSLTCLHVHRVLLSFENKQNDPIPVHTPASNKKKKKKNGETFFNSAGGLNISTSLIFLWLILNPKM